MYNSKNSITVTHRKYNNRIDNRLDNIEKEIRQIGKLLETIFDSLNQFHEKIDKMNSK